MDTHEYQAKTILKKYGLVVPDFAVVSNLAEAREAINRLNLDEAVVKVQVHAGGRGKAGGVKLARSRK
jgi:succinyl-CoA synthetase beta subunit